MAGGVAAGFLIANHLSRRGIAGGPALEPSDLPNQISLAVGDSFPDLTVRDGEDSLLALGPFILDCKTVLGFVSKGCEPCDELRKYLQGHDAVRTGACKVVLLAVGVQGYDAGGFDVYRVDRPTIDELEIHIFPTVIGLTPGGKIVFVSSGFSRVMTAPAIGKYLSAFADDQGADHG
jgi:hypothetical protein